MKKTYKNPTIKIVSLQSTPILAGSPGYTNTTTDATSGNLSRSGSFWDDEE
ncbi:MAG: hypothetical protein IJ559_05065 [Prevotella sp.]|nr:hypothetical protein [Prevotella sp.]